MAPNHSMTLAIELLGRPRVLRDGREAAPPWGAKTWGLLAYLLLSERPPSRQRLADVLFPGADDPLGALRWALSELRRTLGDSVQVRGDPVVAALPAVYLNIIGAEGRDRVIAGFGEAA